MPTRANKLVGALTRNPKTVSAPGTPDQNKRVSIPENVDQGAPVSIPENPNQRPTPIGERVSPGIYRNAQGALTDIRGRVLQRPPAQTPPLSQPSPQPLPQQIQQQPPNWGNIFAHFRPGEVPQYPAPQNAFMQPPPNVPVQPWELMNQGPNRPAMQTPYDRYKWAMQQRMNAATQQQPAQDQQQQQSNQAPWMPYNSVIRGA